MAATILFIFLKKGHTYLRKGKMFEKNLVEKNAASFYVAWNWVDLLIATGAEHILLLILYY